MAKEKKKLVDTIGSWEDRTYWLRVPAALLYPSLGAPTCVSEKGFLHVLLLGPEWLTPEHVNRCLRIFGEYEPIQKLKSCRTVPNVAGPLLESVGAITLRKIADPKKPVEIADIGFKGILAESVLEHYQKAIYEKDEKDEKDPAARKAMRESDKQRYDTLWHVCVDLKQLENRWKSGDLSPLAHVAQFQPTRRFFLHWMGNPEAPLQQECQEATLERILTSKVDVSSVREDRWFLGDRIKSILRGAKSGPQLPGWNLDTLEPDPTTPLTTYHPFYLSPPKYSNVGFLSDLHLVTKFRLLRHSDIRVVPHWDDARGNLQRELVPTVGSQVVDTVETLKRHFQSIQNSTANMMVIGGDLVDFFADLLPSDPVARSLMGQATSSSDNDGDGSAEPRFPTIWNACEIASSKGKRDKSYQEGTSALGFYHMVARFVTNPGSNKPVFVLAGNHDSYRKPYGISPRVDFMWVPALEITKANGGIPADSNLTILEACLAFGSSYETWLDSLNFDKYTLELFYLLYSPLRTWTTGWGNQQPLCLDWGDDEGMFWTEEGGDRLGHLPHATDALLASELPVVDWATEQKRSVMAFSHYTWACYKETIPITPQGVVGRFGTSTNFLGQESDVTKYNVGTCEEERSHMYKLFWDKKIQLAISGHAHRAGVYCMTGGTDTKGKWHEGYDGKDWVWITGWHFDQFPLAQHRDKTLFIVSDSAGPLPRENRGDMVSPSGHDGPDGKHYKGEWGSRPPSWTLVRFDGSGVVSGIESVYATNKNTKPRLAVTLDYMEVFHAGDYKQPPPAMQPNGNPEPMPPRRFVSKPLWHVQRYQNANLQAWDAQCLRKFDPDEDRYFTNLFSALVSESIDKIKSFKRREPGIRFFFNTAAMPLPAGQTIAGLDLLWQQKKGGAILRIHLDYSPNSQYLILRAKSANATTPGLQLLLKWIGKSGEAPKNLWFRWSFSGQGKYATESPWILWAKGGTFKAQGHSQIWMRRDLTPNERPDLGLYH